MISLVAFDLDDTLAHSKSAISSEMAAALADVLQLIPVCIISGGRFEQFRDQVLTHLPSGAALENLHLMPTCGTRYLTWQGDDWHEVYSNDLSVSEKQRASAALESAAKELDLWEAAADVYGDRVEDRGSQITFSALGQRAPVDKKKAWDPSGSKREALRARVAVGLPDLEVRAGGSTSIDVTRKGIDKAYGIQQLAEQLDLNPAAIHFVGDRLDPGGNDYPVLRLGVSSKAVRNCDETLSYIDELIRKLDDSRPSTPVVRPRGA